MIAHANTGFPKPALLKGGHDKSGTMILGHSLARFMAVSLALVAIGFWLVPGLGWGTGVLLIQLALAVIVFYGGVCLVKPQVRRAGPAVQIDTIRREVRKVQPSRRGAAIVLERYAFADLSRAERIGNHMRLFGPAQTLVAEVTLTKRSALNSLVSGLQDAGKLD